VCQKKPLWSVSRDRSLYVEPEENIEKYRGKFTGLNVRLSMYVGVSSTSLRHSFNWLMDVSVFIISDVLNKMIGSREVEHV